VVEEEEEARLTPPPSRRQNFASKVGHNSQHLKGRRIEEGAEYDGRKEGRKEGRKVGRKEGCSLYLSL
jgi:hypothetical protein